MPYNLQNRGFAKQTETLTRLEFQPDRAMNCEKSVTMLRMAYYLLTNLPRLTHRRSLPCNVSNTNYKTYSLSILNAG